MTAPVGPADPPLASLRAVVARFGTPVYVYDLPALRSRIGTLRAALPAGVEVLYSVKANPSLGLCEVLAGHGLGAEVSSIGELLVARRAGFAADRIMVSGPHKSPPMIDRLRELPGTLVSIDSVDELHALSEMDGLRLVLRLRPDFEPFGEMIMADRFGIPLEELRRGMGARVVGFHVYGGSQVLDGSQAAKNLAGAFDLGLRAADRLGVDIGFLDVGGGFGVPAGRGESELDLGPVRDELGRQRAELRAGVRLAIELGRYLVAGAGFYLTSVLGGQTRGGRPAVVVDGGVHQRPDLCGLDLSRRAAPPFSLTGSQDPAAPTDVLGCLCLPGDVLAEAAMLPPLTAGAVLVFANAGAYGLSAAPMGFLSHPLPPEVAVDGDTVLVLRDRAEPDAHLRGQHGLSGGRSWAPPAG